MDAPARGMIASVERARGPAGLPAGAPPRACFVADLHLDGGETSRARLRRLLEHVTSWGASLYILGDLFHYWLGPRHLALPMYREELRLLSEATAAGISIGVIPGNRDFLLDDAFTGATAVAVVGDELEIRAGADRVHLSHGDLFGSADVRYLRMRRVLHSRTLRFLARRLPVRALEAVARRLRRHSKRVVARKKADVLEPDRAMVAALFERGFRCVICGHFHHHHDEIFPPGEGGGRFIILEPHEKRGFVLTHDGVRWGSLHIQGEGSA